MALYSGHTDEQLLQLLQNSSEAAFTELYDRYWEKMLVRANMQLESPEDAEEILQDIFIRLWKRRETIVLRHSFHTYIASILKYECYRLLAEKKARKLLTGYGDLPEKPDHSTEQWLDYEDVRAELEKTVQQSGLPHEVGLCVSEGILSSIESSLDSDSLINLEIILTTNLRLSWYSEIGAIV